MPDLESQLRDLAARPPVPPTPVAAISARAERVHTRRIAGRAAVSVVAVLLLAGLGLGVRSARGPIDAPDLGDRPATTSAAPETPGSQPGPPNTDDPNDEGYVTPRQLEMAPIWIQEYDPAEVELITEQANGGVHLTGIVSTLEFRRACRSLKDALDIAVARPGDVAAIHEVMDPALALIDERTQYRGEEYLHVLTRRLDEGATESVAAQFGPGGSCSRSLVVGSTDEVGG